MMSSKRERSDDSDDDGDDDHDESGQAKMESYKGTGDNERDCEEDYEGGDDEEGTVESSDEDKKPAARETGDTANKPKKRRRRRVISTLQESKWQQMYQRLLVYRHKYGNCLVPNRYAEDPSLGAWVATQRRNYRVFMSDSDEPSGMTAERVRSLEAIGFQWTTTDPRHEPWDVRYEELREFVNKYGHAEIPMRWEENVQLSNWVSKQRQDYKLRMKGKSSRLTDERMKKLNDLDFKWHIPRKGRKIKQKSIPIIKRNLGSLGRDPPSQDMAAAVSAHGSETTGGLASASALPTSIFIPGTDNSSTSLTGDQFRNHAQVAAAQMPPPPGVAALPNVAGGQAFGQQWSGINPATLLGLQGSNVYGIDLSTLLGLQNTSVPSNTGWGASSLNPSTAGNQANPGGYNQPVQGQPSAPLQGQAPAAAILLPIQIGDLLSNLQQQQVVPVSMPWASSSDASNAYGLQGIILNLPANMAGAAPVGAAPSSQTAVSNLLASQFLNVVGAPGQPLQQQQQFSNNGLASGISQPQSGFPSFAALQNYLGTGANSGGNVAQRPLLPGQQQQPQQQRQEPPGHIYYQHQQQQQSQQQQQPSSPSPWPAPAPDPQG